MGRVRRAPHLPPPQRHLLRLDPHTNHPLSSEDCTKWARVLCPRHTLDSLCTEKDTCGCMFHMCATELCAWVTSLCLLRAASCPASLRFFSFSDEGRACWFRDSAPASLSSSLTKFGTSSLLFAALLSEENDEYAADPARASFFCLI